MMMLTPFGALLTLAMFFVIGKVALMTAWMLLPEMAAAVLSVYLMGMLSTAVLNAIEVPAGKPELPLPGANFFTNFGRTATLAFKGLDRASAALGLDRAPNIDGPLAIGGAAFVLTFAMAMSISGAWAEYTSTGHWDPTGPVTLSAIAGISTGVWICRRPAASRKQGLSPRQE